ncbi:GNAT family N-acetyltransferase [bacterium]|nr:MAG: GNAT family N-acetyltransferase [bacterium]
MAPIITLLNGFSVRVFNRNDVISLYNSIQKNKEHLFEWKAWYEHLDTKRNVQLFVDENENQCARLLEDNGFLVTHPGFQFGIFNTENEVVGMIGFQAFNLRNKISSLGYWLDSDEQGKGIITQAAKRVIEFGWDVIGIHRFEIQAWVGNERSVKVAERLGFVHETILKEVEYRDGKFLDHHLFRLIPSDVNR